MAAMLPFHAVDTATAQREVLTLAVILGRPDLPTDTYVFLEYYCPLPRCDCRRVVLEVRSAGTKRQVATLHHFFDPPKDTKPQTTLAQGNPQSEYSPALLEAFTRDVLDATARARLEDHYQAFKRAVADPAHPIQKSLPPEARTVREPTRTAPKVNRNDPCPCGSGKKYKKCHGAGAG